MSHMSNGHVLSTQKKRESHEHVESLFYPNCTLRTGQLSAKTLIFATLVLLQFWTGLCNSQTVSGQMSLRTNVSGSATAARASATFGTVTNREGLRHRWYAPNPAAPWLTVQGGCVNRVLGPRCPPCLGPKTGQQLGASIIQLHLGRTGGIGRYFSIRVQILQLQEQAQEWFSGTEMRPVF